MVKNKTEALISKSMIAINSSNFWMVKLHNNLLAHQPTPADYICNYTFEEIMYSALIEAKQVTLKNEKGRLGFNRLKQINDMLNFISRCRPYHKAYFFITYKNKFWRDSEIYMIPVLKMKKIIDEHNYVSLNREDAKLLLKKYKLDLGKGSIIDLYKILISKYKS